MLLYEYRPTKRAQDELLSLALDAERPLQSISSMRDFNWLSLHDPGPIVAHACDLIERLIDETELRIKRLRHFAISMKLESSTKFQDWIARQIEFENIGQEVRS